MKIAKASYEIETSIDSDVLLHIERAGRTCYKSEDRITENSARKFVAMVIARGHHSVLEHASLSVRFVCDRGISHEIVRHRIASYSQESTRYCNYGKDKFGNEITVIDPRPHITDYQFVMWKEVMERAEEYYFDLLSAGASPQMARSVLPNSLKTELVMSANLREWRHFFSLRTPKTAHPQIREIAQPLLAELRICVPIIFDDVGVVEEGAE